MNEWEMDCPRRQRYIWAVHPYFAPMPVQTEETVGTYLPLIPVHPYLDTSAHISVASPAHRLTSVLAPPNPGFSPSLVSLPLVSIADRCGVSSAALASGYPNAREVHPKSNAPWTCSHAPVPSCRAVDETCLTEAAFPISKLPPRPGGHGGKGHGLAGFRSSGYPFQVRACRAMAAMATSSLSLPVYLVLVYPLPSHPSILDARGLGTSLPTASSSFIPPPPAPYPFPSHPNTSPHSHP